MAGLDSLRAWIEEGAVDTVIVAFPDMQGRPVGKRVTSSFFLSEVARHGFEACEYLLAVDVDMEPLSGYEFASWATGYGDVTVIPDYVTTRLVPWLDGTALVLGDLTDEQGAPVEVSPRRILRRQVERAAERGLRVRCATELEFFLFDESPDEAAAKRWHDLTPQSRNLADYQLLQTSAAEPVLRRVRNEMVSAGIPVEFSKGEAGRGQHEVNVTYAEPLETADRHLIFKNGVKEIAAQEGRACTFMAKWTMGDAGSSCHLHTSLWSLDTDQPLMAGEGPSGLSPVGEQFLAGQLHAARELSWCFAPYVNSYRRYVPGSWAPTAVVWGSDNRTCGFRVIGKGAGRRIENRVPGADVNPYLALAAAIAAGLFGVDHELPLEPAFVGNAYEAENVERIPGTFVEALQALESSEVAQEAFGADVHRHLANTAAQEWAAANRVVTDWELARNFERI